MSGGSQQVGGAPPWLQDQARGLFDWGGNLAQQPYQPYTQQRVANQSPLQQLGFGGMQNLAWGSPAMDSAGRQLNDTINGGYDNQFTDQVVGRTRQGVTDAFNNATATNTRRFNNAGGWGSDRHMLATRNNEEALATGLADAESSVRNANYESERGRQMQASQMAPQLWGQQISGLSQILGAGAQDRGYEQELLNSLYGDFTDQRDQGWNNFGRIAGLFGGNPASTFGQQQPGRDPMNTGLGLAMLGNSKGGGGTGLGTSLFGPS